MSILLTLLSIGNFIDTLGDDILIGLVSCIVCVVTAYIIIREKILKNEIKTDQIKQYIDNHVRVLDTKIIKIQEDIIEFKEINKETSRSLTENTAAIRELKLVLNMLKEQLNYERRRQNTDDQE